jgi:D-alanyl-lipoteichoic acid acyltransferase DltB (MBOAT superfamily)
MLFNSFEFIFVFLPVTLGLYFFLNHRGLYDFGKIWLVLASMVFYGWWNPSYLVLILTSVLVNFAVAYHMANAVKYRKLLLWIGLIFNLALLGYYKYANFFISNVNVVLSTDFNVLNIILPLGISFFTFSQIAYLVDTYKGIVKEFNIVNYGLFVLFFPPLLSGPIVHHKEVMPQFEDRSARRINFENISKGLFLFNIGLAKKIIIADTFGEVVNRGYGNFELLNTLQSWITAFAYTVQLYFDFSGYSDMAIGIALMFNIVLPINFWSPHKAENIQQFYRRWHITLSRFLRDYVYIPLGGNKVSEARVNFNLFLTFLIGGLWHGANWTFVIWGAMNGAALVVHRLFQKTRIVMPHVMAVLITFLFVMLVRIFFRSPEFTTAVSVIAKMDRPGAILLLIPFTMRRCGLQV